MKKKWKLCLALCGLVLLWGGVLWRQGALPIQASASGKTSAVTSDSIREKENQISQKKEEKKALQGGLSDLKEIKKNLESQKNNLKDYVRQLDGELELIEQNIAALKAQISAKEEEIRQTEEELEEALEREENQKESMIVHIRLMYETGTPSILDLLLQSRSMGDFLNKADHEERVASYDQAMWQNYRMVREYVELCKEDLELEKEILDETKAGVEAEQQNLEELIEQKHRDITAYEADINNKEKAIQEYEAEIKAQEDEIKLLEAAVAEERRKLIASNASVLKYDGGMFKFPMASYTRMSDDYGMRMHPILGVEQFHNGVDFAAPAGTAIYAAYDGKVVAAAYSTSMGNYCFIDHGDGLYTIYMHASALYVKNGDIVARGDTIAAVGSTGRSTGNHLHFSVRLNGSYVSPWNYLKE
ncbi:murein hydrolase activator EnvC family protein [Acetatifactor muris]|uniref:murein hydrolase activator EnvC family protein n=1 Tax=Acetatifactor muris TaxID=879566 RepID=UPI0023F49D04|nr:peptidoglycan DD-metalloendopeptidase family protein [Acetatifactor muris]